MTQELESNKYDFTHTPTHKENAFLLHYIYLTDAFIS